MFKKLLLITFKYPSAVLYVKEADPMKKSYFVFVLILVLVSIAGCEEKELTVMTSQQVSPLVLEAAAAGVDVMLSTEDYRTIAATFYDIESDRSAILLHAMGKDRSSWDNFIPILINAGYNVMTLDLRGHGESEGDHHEFGMQEFSAMYMDVEAAKNHLVLSGRTGDVLLIGASIGANTALRYAVEDEDVSKLILLSPGLEYRGSKTEDVIHRYHGNLLFVVSDDDLYARQSSTRLFALSKVTDDKKEYIGYKGKAHGTDMFSENNLADDIVSWLKKQ